MLQLVLMYTRKTRLSSSRVASADFLWTALHTSYGTLPSPVQTLTEICEHLSQLIESCIIDTHRTSILSFPLHHPWTVPLVDQVAQWVQYASSIIPNPKNNTLIAWWIGINDTGDSTANDTVRDCVAKSTIRPRTDSILDN